MTRWSLCLCAALLATACTSDGGPGTESPSAGAGAGGAGGTSGAAGTAGSGGEGAVGAGGAAGAGGIAGHSGAGGLAAGQGGAAGVTDSDAGGMGGAMSEEDSGVADEGYCTVACTGIPPEDDVVDACSMITSLDECTMFETGGFPASCRWVTPDSEPCLAP